MNYLAAKPTLLLSMRFLSNLEEFKGAIMSETIVKITGMTCGHCEGRVTAELSKLDGVSEVKASATDAQAVVTSAGALDADAISRAVIAAGYRVTA